MTVLGRTPLNVEKELPLRWMGIVLIQSVNYHGGDVLCVNSSWIRSRISDLLGLTAIVQLAGTTLVVVSGFR
jgi:hypothetical protein